MVMSPYFSFFQEWESDSGQKPQCDKPIKLSAFETFDIGYISNLFEILDNALCYTWTNKIISLFQLIIICLLYTSDAADEL